MSMSLSPRHRQTRSPPTPALANSPVLAHNQTQLNPKQPTDPSVSKIPVIRLGPVSQEPTVQFRLQLLDLKKRGPYNFRV